MGDSFCVAVALSQTMPPALAGAEYPRHPNEGTILAFSATESESAALRAQVGMAPPLAWKRMMEREAKVDRIARRPDSGRRSAREARPAAHVIPVILCVDDEPDLLTLFRLFLSAQGFEVISANNAVEALQAVAEHRPDLIVTDCVMPGMSGLELCRALRERPDTRDIPIILHSGNDLLAEDARLFDRLVMKPVELQVFAGTIRALLAVSRTRDFS